MYDRILLPADGSENAQAAAPHALELASRFGAELHVLYVIDANAFVMDFEHTELSSQDLTRSFEQAGRRAIDPVLEKAEAADIRTEGFTVEAGSIAGGIVQHAEDHDVDVIVMGTHGRTGVQRFLLGSVTERVLRTSDVSILVVPPDGDGRNLRTGAAASEPR